MITLTLTREEAEILINLVKDWAAVLESGTVHSSEPAHLTDVEKSFLKKVIAPPCSLCVCTHPEIKLHSSWTNVAEEP